MTFKKIVRNNIHYLNQKQVFSSEKNSSKQIFPTFARQQATQLSKCCLYHSALLIRLLTGNTIKITSLPEVYQSSEAQLWITQHSFAIIIFNSKNCFSFSSTFLKFFPAKYPTVHLQVPSSSLYRKSHCLCISNSENFRVQSLNSAMGRCLSNYIMTKTLLKTDAKSSNYAKHQISKQYSELS